MQQYQNVLQDKFGNVIVGASVAVYVYGTTAPATIYSGNGTGLLPSNTVTTSSLGEFAFYAANGRYSLSITATNFVAESYSDFILYDPADIGAVAASSVAFTPFGTVAATNVQNAIQEVVTDLSASGGAALVGFSPSGTLSSTTVQNAIQEVVTDLSASSGASLVGFLQSGTGAVARTVQAKERDVVSVKDFGAKGDGVTDDTAAIQKAATSISLTGGDLWFPAGDYIISTHIDFTGNNVNVLLSHNAGILYSATPDYVAFKFTGSNCSVIGGLGRGFIGPASWDGTNSAPTYGVLWFTGDFPFVQTRLYNIRRTGIWFKDILNGTVNQSILIGNYPSSSWTGVETGHVGICVDPPAANSGNFKINNNYVASCVQGCFAGNYGSGGTIQGFAANGNIFEGCWNHGIYTANTNGAVISGNNFNRCQIPVVISGDKNVVSGNSMYTSVATAGDARDSVGISVRDGSGNVVTGNSIKGVLTASNIAAINVQDVSGASQLNENLINSNNIEITDGVGYAIRIIGSSNSLSRNIVEGNSIKCVGPGVALGAITLNGPSGNNNYGNKIANNTIALTGQGEGIWINNQISADIRGNTTEFLWNSGSATNVYSVRINNTANCNIDSNNSVVRSGYGTNLTVYGYREEGTASNNRMANLMSVMNGSATYNLAITVAASGLTIDQVGTGAPALQAKIGSIWRRSDGGAGSTLYIKESGTDATGWVAK